MEVMPLEVRWPKMPMKRNRCWRRKCNDDDSDNDNVPKSSNLGVTDSTTTVDSKEDPKKNRQRCPKKKRESAKALAELVLAQYNKDKGTQYEYVKWGPNNPARSGKRDWHCLHMNFFAKLKGTDSSPELVFAVLYRRTEVVHCCILNPKPYSHDDILHERRVYHCKDVECSACANIDQQILCNRDGFIYV